LLRPQKRPKHSKIRLKEADPVTAQFCARAEHRVSNTRERTMFAVIKTGGKQYRVAANDKLEIGRIKGEPGEIVAFADVLVVGGETTVLGNPTVAGATVAAEVLDQSRGAKIIAFKKRRRKNSRRKRGHRQDFTLIRITEILTDGKQPDMTRRVKAEKKPAPVAAPAASDSEDDEAPAKPKAKASTKKSAKAPAAKKDSKAKAGSSKSKGKSTK
jgi:large subunit ribosomal protein L21